MNLKVPKLQRQAFAIIERYRRQESSVEETLIEMYLAGKAQSSLITKTDGTGYPLGSRDKCSTC